MLRLGSNLLKYTDCVKPAPPALGCAAEWAHLPITLPIDCLSTKIQTSKSDAGAFTLMSAMLSEKVSLIFDANIVQYQPKNFKSS